MTAFAETVLTVGSAQVAHAAMSAALWAVVWTSAALLLIGQAARLCRYIGRRRRPRVPTQPNVVVFDATSRHDCPWCTPDNGVIDSALCNCKAPCGSHYCGRLPHVGLREPSDDELDDFIARWYGQQGEQR